MSKTSRDILKEEMDRLVDDIINAYEQSGKKTSGQFEELLEVKEKSNGFELFGAAYLAGRPAGKMPPVEEIERWVKLKGLAPIEETATTSSLAWAIAKKIAREGTRDEASFPIYETILTPQRMDEIIEKVSSFHVQQFVNDITLAITSISQKYTK